ncbi:uncharacterized protein LY89DRAFT_741115 [Mollisia scopiformis]|uniref:2EXR domain-containing protein n=1 Tax=Mollisia scopiformis TaxID=149040 RepID=A0A132BAH3_MOLSC|nr:uncharacterized protein LY89DRAFT_741115 [Mollisia scopiformis]KUJ09402.1 hypothetical protein LY89DRAFT_741115 [Mollisia scopiformis]
MQLDEMVPHSRLRSSSAMMSISNSQTSIEQPDDSVLRPLPTTTPTVNHNEQTPEIRRIIWELTLTPRILDVDHYFKTRRVSRVSDDCAVGDETPGSWETFFDPEISRNTMFSNAVTAFDESWSPTGVEVTCISVIGIMDACSESREVILSSGYTRIFPLLGFRATTLFSSLNDTFYIRQGAFIKAFFFWYGFMLGSAVVDVKHLAIGTIRHGFSGDCTLANERDMFRYAVNKDYKNIEELTLALEYDVGSDRSNLVFMDIEDIFGTSQAATPQFGPEMAQRGKHPLEANCDRNSVRLFELERQKLAQWLLRDIDMFNVLPNEAYPNERNEKNLKVNRKIVTTSEIKATFKDAVSWCKARMLRRRLFVFNQRTRCTTHAVADESSTVKDICDIWVSDNRLECNMHSLDKIQLWHDGTSFDPTTRILDINSILDGGFLYMLVWDGKCWRW